MYGDGGVSSHDGVPRMRPLEADALSSCADASLRAEQCESNDLMRNLPGQHDPPLDADNDEDDVLTVSSDSFWKGIVSSPDASVLCCWYDSPDTGSVMISRDFTVETGGLLAVRHA